ncbi:Hypothetical predicted protein [Cloeon dipterum]|uniref:CHK kinase-like domain-containing protein n=1 Tax=Cloeon dipterum TaxID=197152 RepID=A0A8S1BU54_9INSE|nr:Hypothetical predicted protein [Cloeon dipterum]
MGDDKKSLVHPGDLLAAVRTVYGPQCRIIDLEVTHGTETVQGFLSLMLSAKVKVKTHLGDLKELQVMVKRRPVLAAHVAMIEAMGNNVMARESAFFTTIFPLMKKNCPDLPIVRALVAHEDAIIMEDLRASGFTTIAKSLQDIGRNKKLTFPLARMCVRKLAKIHASSVNIKWRKVMPADFFDPDPLLEGKSSEQFKTFFNLTVQSVIIPIMKKIYLDTPSVSSFVEYIGSPEFFDNVLQFVKYDEENGPNVLLHGDCHLNNMMFKMDKDGNACDMRFIDFQIIRHGPACTDLIYFLYVNATKEFRENHEMDIVRAYVEAFNAEVCTTPDLIDFNKFWKSYERARYYGVVIAMAIRPLQFMPAFEPPSNKGELTDEFFAQADQLDLFSAPAMAAFETDEEFKREVTDIISHTLSVLNKYVFL